MTAEQAMEHAVQVGHEGRSPVRVGTKEECQEIKKVKIKEGILTFFLWSNSQI